MRAAVANGKFVCCRCHSPAEQMVVVEPPAAEKPMISRILLDLDGVLADWVGSVAPLFGHERDYLLGAWPPGTYDIAEVLGVSTAELWRRVHEGGADFWSGLEPLPWCAELLELCQGLAPTTILTSPSRDPSAAAGKTAWLQAQFGSTFRDYLIGPDKPACAHPGALLIDDRGTGCDAFAKAGGQTIVFPQPWNSAWTSSAESGADPLAFVREQLDGFRFAGPKFDPSDTGKFAHLNECSCYEAPCSCGYAARQAGR